MKSANEQHEELMKLVFQIGRLLRTQLKEQLGSHDQLHEKVSPYQTQALFRLVERPLTMGELADELSITLPSTTSLVDRLVKSGLAERNHDADDRRIVRLSVTEEGRSFCEKMKKQHAKIFGYMLEAMPADDVASLHRIFTNLHQSLESHKTKAGE